MCLYINKDVILFSRSQETFDKILTKTWVFCSDSTVFNGKSNSAVGNLAEINPMFRQVWVITWLYKY